MSNILNYKTILIFGSLITLLAGPATAQTAVSNQLQSNSAKHHFSASEVSALLAEFEITTTLAPYTGEGAATILARTSGDARFVISLFKCDNPEDGTQCEGAVIFTATSNAGVAYDDINSFNASTNVTIAVNVAEQNIILFGRQLFFAGGVGRDNFKYITELFLRDMQNYMDAQAAVGTSVSLNVAPAAVHKTDNVVSTKEADVSDAVVFVAKRTPNGGANDYALSAAIANTWQVSFINTNEK